MLYEFAPMTEAVGSCETSVNFYQATSYHVSEDITLQEPHCGELLKTNGVRKWRISAVPRNESCPCWAWLFCKCALFPEHRGSVADIATRYGLDGSGFKPRWGKEIVSSPYPSRRPVSFTMGTGTLPGVKCPERGVEVCLCSTSASPVQC